MTDRREMLVTTGLAVCAMIFLFVAAAFWVYAVFTPFPEGSNTVKILGSLSLLSAAVAAGLFLVAVWRVFR